MGAKTRLRLVEPPRKRGRPRVERTPSPSPHAFDDVVQLIATLPKGRDRMLRKQDAITTVRKDTRVTGAVVKVFSALIDRLWWKDGYSHLSPSKIANEIGVTVRRVEQAIHDLVKFGHIIRQSERISQNRHGVAKTTFPGAVEFYFGTEKHFGASTEKEMHLVPKYISDIPFQSSLKKYSPKRAARSKGDFSSSQKKGAGSTRTAPSNRPAQAARCDSGSPRGDVLVAPARCPPNEFVEVQPASPVYHQYVRENGDADLKDEHGNSLALFLHKSEVERYWR